MNRLRLSPMGIEDLDDIEQIERLSFSTPWPRQAFVKEICDNRLARYYTIKDGNRAVAYGGMWYILDEAHITNFAVHPEYRGRGIGKMLLKGLIDFGTSDGMRSFTLEVSENNHTAIGLYSGMGFVKAGLRNGYYSDTGEDAIIMWLEL